MPLWGKGVKNAKNIKKIYIFCNLANFNNNVFSPAASNLTTALTSGADPDTDITSPIPNLSCRTLSPAETESAIGPEKVLAFSTGLNLDISGLTLTASCRTCA